MHDHDMKLQRLLDHPPQDVPLPSTPAFTQAVMSRLLQSASAPTRSMPFVGWSIAAAVLVIACLLPNSWLTDGMDMTVSWYDAETLDTVLDLLVASIGMGLLLLVSRRSLA